MPRLRDVDRFDAWMRRLLVNACYAEARRRRRHLGHIRALRVEDEATSDDTLTVADRDELERAFRRLPPEQRAIVVLHHYEGLRLTEIAASLAIPEGTARSRLHYATRTLRAALKADAPAIARGRRA